MLAGVVFATPAFSHATLVSTDPVDGVVLSGPPATITLTFNEPVTPTALRLAAPDGATTDLTDFRVDGSAVVATLPAALASGTFALTWRVVSSDGHPVGGAFVFSVGQVTRTGTVSTSDPVLRVLIWLTRTALYYSLFIGAAGCFFVVWIGIPSSALGAVKRILRASMIAGLVAVPIAFALQGVDLIAGSLGSAVSIEAWRASLTSTYTATLVLASLALLGGLMALGGARARHLISGAAFIAIGIAFALSGHASRAPPVALTWLVVFIHTTAVAFWTGALVPLAFALRDRTNSAATTLARFSAAIPQAIAPLIIAGVILIVVQVRALSDLWETPYGRILSAKLILVVGLLALALLNRYRLTPAFRLKPTATAPALRRSVIVETGIVLLVFAVVAGWRFTPPPRSLATTTTNVPSFFTHLHGTDLAADVDVAPGRTGPVTVTVFLYDADLVPITVLDLNIAIENADAGIGRIAQQAELGDDGRWIAAFTVPVGGTWTITLDARVSMFDLRSIAGPIVIATN